MEGIRVRIMIDLDVLHVDNPYDEAVMKLDSEKGIFISDLAGNYTNGEAHVCVDNNGKLFAKEGACN